MCMCLFVCEGGGGGVRDEGDRQLQRPPRPANNGERPNIQLPRTGVDEPSERDGGSPSGENAAQEGLVGRQLEQDQIGNENGGTPALQLPDDKGRSGGGQQPGRWSPGGWRSEGGSRIFLPASREGLKTFNFTNSI